MFIMTSLFLVFVAFAQVFVAWPQNFIFIDKPLKIRPLDLELLDALSDQAAMIMNHMG